LLRVGFLSGRHFQLVGNEPAETRKKLLALALASKNKP
jgi:hypothetical protein